MNNGGRFAHIVWRWAGGSALAQILLAHDKRVRIVKRSAGEVPEGVELVQGDAADLIFASRQREERRPFITA